MAEVWKNLINLCGAHRNSADARIPTQIIMFKTSFRLPVFFIFLHSLRYIKSGKILGSSRGTPSDPERATTKYGLEKTSNCPKLLLLI